jgi:C-terminal processing protease CtpA/Prc
MAALWSATPASAQDSNVVRARAVITVEQDLQRLARQLVEMRSYEEGLVRMMLEEQAKVRTIDDESERREIEALVASLRNRMQTTSTQARSMQRELESLCRSVPRSEGWVGVAVNSPVTVVEQKTGEVTFRYQGPPRVESVDPGSPADKAGIRSGDILIAIDGRDLQRGGISFTEFHPDMKLPFKVLRGDGRTRTLVVTVEPRPDALNRVPCPWVDARIARALVPTPAEFYRYEVAAGQRTSAGARGGVGSRIRPRTADTLTVVTSESSLPASGFVTVPFPSFVGGTGSVAGMVVRRLGESLAQVFDVTGGLMVERVSPGPAHRAGLRPEDVLLTADDTILVSPRVLQRIIENRTRTGEREVRLVVRRGKERQTIRLRW